MSKFIIRGQKPLSGEIEVFGSKNTAIKIIAACVLIKGQVILDNVPDILDVQKIISILEKLGGKFVRQGHQLQIDMSGLKPGDPDPDLVRTMRASVVLVGPLLARFEKVKIPHPGGCVIGPRPIDRHIKAFRELGVEVKEGDDSYEFNVTAEIGDRVDFQKISVTATENILLFACLQRKKISIFNAAIEPEVIDLIEFLKKAGIQANLRERKIEIHGAENLKGVRYSVIPDRIEAGTFAIMAATTRSILKITQIIPEHIRALLEKLRLMGVEFEEGKDFLYIKKSPQIRPIDISTAEYPGFPTDLQSPMGVLLTQAQGRSRLKENIFENRLIYLKELQLMGAKVEIISPQEAAISGPTLLSGTKIPSLDLRAGATLIIAGLIAKGQTVIEGAEIIDRGYEKIEERLGKIGADIKRVG